MTAETFSPYPQFFDLAGKPIDSGYVYYGVAGLAPESNPITVYWDAAGTIPAAQPIRTIAGYPARSGAPANIFVNAAYSILIKDKNGTTVAQRDAVDPELGNPTPYSTIALARSDSLLVAGETVVTLGYWEDFDGGEALYLVRTLTDYQADHAGASPDNLIDHLVTGGALVLELQHNRVIDAQQCGVRENVESGTAWNNAFWRAAALSVATDEPVKFVCNVNVLTSKTLHLSQKPASASQPGEPCFVEVYHPGTITAVGGGDFEAHLNNEMARLTALHGSTVALGSALAAQFCKADPQITTFLGDKIERPIPLISFVNQGREITFGEIVCDFWCSGIRIDRSQTTKFLPGMGVRKFRKYGLLYTQNSNNAIWTMGATVKQIALSDTSNYEGRIMPGGYIEPQSRNHMGDCVVVLQKDMMWTQGWWGWSRSAVTLLNKCGSSTTDRWAGRTMYPDYFSRWSDDAWTGKGGQINAPEWDRMAPSAGTGDCDFYGIHVMQGTAQDEDGEQAFRVDGLAFGGQVSIENWNAQNPNHFYGIDVDSSVILNFGPGARYYQPTGIGANTSKGSIFAPTCRWYCAAGEEKLDTAHMESNGFTNGIFPFDRGRNGTPDIHSYPGNYDIWNSRNRNSTGDYTGPIQYRGTIESGATLLPSSSVTTVGDFFVVRADGTYGGQAFNKGDLAVAVALTPGTAFGSNWRRAINQDFIALNADKAVTVSKPINVLIPRDNNVPSIWITKPAGYMVQRMETGTTSWVHTFDGQKLTLDVPDQYEINAALKVKVPKPMGYGVGSGVAVVVQGTSRTTAVTCNAPTMGIQLFSAAGSATPASFTVNNSLVTQQDTILPTVRSSTNKYQVAITNVGSGSFEVTFWSISGTATDAPVFNFNLITGANS